LVGWRRFSTGPEVLLAYKADKKAPRVYCNICVLMTFFYEQKSDGYVCVWLDVGNVSGDMERSTALREPVVSRGQERAPPSD